MAASILPAADKPKEVLTGKVVEVAEGDMMTILVDQKKHIIRLNAIDAPENGQPFFKESRDALSKKVNGKAVRVEVIGMDRQGREIGDLTLDGEFINEWLLKEGWAWNFVKYSPTKRFADIEKKAYDAKKGLWADPDAESPWDYRDRIFKEKHSKK
ncbi:thermonuclease family protein [bacterium]|nr:thermonuclease family protein [bacterium]